MASNSLQKQGEVGHSIAIAALLIMAGNFLSRIVALGRDQVIAGYFGVGIELSLFTILSAIPTYLYDMLVGGLLSAALIPVFSEYAERDREEFWHIVSSIFSIVLLIVALFGAVVWMFPSFFSNLLASGLLEKNHKLTSLASSMLRLMAIAIVFMALKGLCEAVLQAQRRFLLPALSTSLFNLGIIVALLLFSSLGISVLAVGMVVGAVAQVLIQLPGLELSRLRHRFDFRHPAVRRIGLLYLPVAIGMSFSLVGTTVDRILAGSLGDDPASVMRYATNLIQFVLGMIAAAVGLAILPTLSRLSSDEDETGFHTVFGMGLKVVLMLIIPAMVLLGALATPIIRLLLEHGKFTADDTAVTSLALLVYLPSLVAAAVDQLFIFSFYARKKTLLPNLVQGIAIGCYLLVALLMYRRLGMYGLILANVIQHTTHMVVMLWLGQRQFRLLSGQRLGEALWKIGLASLVAGGLGFSIAWALNDIGDGTKLTAFFQVIFGSSIGLLVYFLLLYKLGVEALQYFFNALTRRFRRQKVPSERGTF